MTATATFLFCIFAMMKTEIKIELPAEWKLSRDNYTDDNGETISHIEASMADDSAFFEVHAGPMPDGETAEDQAFANYAESVGFDDDDEGSPIVKFKWNGKNAWGFEALCEDEKPVRLIAQEVKSGLLAIIIIGANDETQLEKVSELVESRLRVSVL